MEQYEDYIAWQLEGFGTTDSFNQFSTMTNEEIEVYCTDDYDDPDRYKSEANESFTI